VSHECNLREENKTEKITVGNEAIKNWNKNVYARMEEFDKAMEARKKM
jgi:hypothetical protein